MGPRIWHLEPAAGEPVRGRERSGVGAFFGAVFGRLPAHFDFAAGAGPAFTVHRRFGIRLRFAVDIVAAGLVVAQVLALDAFG